MGDKGSGSFFRSFLESGLGRCIASLVEEVKSDSRLVAEDMRSFSGGIRSDISGLCGKLGHISDAGGLRHAQRAEGCAGR